MKGIVFNLLERVVTDTHGDDAWDDLLQAADSHGAYTAVGSYPDEEFLGLVTAASEKLGTPADDLVRWFGRESMPHFARLYPHFFEGHPDTMSFALTLNDVIHPEVRKLFPGADVPVFEFGAPEKDSLQISYASERKLCSFAEGLLEGAATRYGERVEVVHESCMKRGDARCVLRCRFEAA